MRCLQQDPEMEAQREAVGGKCPSFITFELRQTVVESNPTHPFLFCPISPHQNPSQGRRKQRGEVEFVQRTISVSVFITHVLNWTNSNRLFTRANGHSHCILMPVLWRTKAARGAGGGRWPPPIPAQEGELAVSLVCPLEAWICYSYSLSGWALVVLQMDVS